MRLLGVLTSIFGLIALAVIFFALFTPAAFFMRLLGRDVLRLKLSKKPSHWIPRNGQIKPESFENQSKLF
tara:strand:- start:593 stop:802 length:210 start_codon:yes stop_codon:yes gene_type:complete